MYSYKRIFCYFIQLPSCVAAPSRDKKKSLVFHFSPLTHEWSFYPASTVSRTLLQLQSDYSIYLCSYQATIGHHDWAAVISSTASGAVACCAILPPLRGRGIAEAAWTTTKVEINRCHIDVINFLISEHDTRVADVKLACHGSFLGRVPLTNGVHLCFLCMLKRFLNSKIEVLLAWTLQPDSGL